ncbi:MAG: fibronectin type III domain-containing protein [Candidatus Accumulibacter sp.]|uniref:fibronectin type III domain-containing protein n=1 Tax=Accumulibacter sp. TaxID=2053492 RepID=UPI0025852794|nr:fibronectin type III domain-containing protein [Accumulibacter sp.]MCM8621406.1 fibronectin type III domain-containing protein [Accumulibacter sp.]
MTAYVIFEVPQPSPQWQSGCEDAGEACACRSWFDTVWRAKPREAIGNGKDRSLFLPNKTRMKGLVVALAVLLLPQQAFARWPPPFHLPPSPPTNVGAVYVARSTSPSDANLVDAMVKWAPPAQSSDRVDSYVVSWRQDGQSWGQTATTALAQRMPCPQNGRPTVYGVSARTRAGTSPPAFASLTCYDRPALPTNITVTPLSGTGALVSWRDNAVGESAYWLNVYRAGQSSDMRKLGPYPANATSATVTNLIANTDYYVQVWATTNGGLTGTTLGSDWVPFHTSPTASIPPPPTDLRANAISSSKIHLTWTDNATAPHGLEMQHSLDGVNWPPASDDYPRIFPAGPPSGDDQNLRPATHHYYRARFFTDAGDSGFSNVADAFTWATSPPPAPSNLVATATSSSTVHLDFTDNSSNAANEEFFLFSISYDNGANWQGDFGKSAVNAYDAQGLPPNAAVKFRVRATNTVNGVPVYSNYSNVATATTPGGGAPRMRFANESSYPVISLVVDGSEYFPQAPLGLLSGAYLELTPAAGVHTYVARTGFWLPDGSRQPLYQTSGSITQGTGLVTVHIVNPPIGSLLTLFSTGDTVGYWSGGTWEGTFQHSQAFCFTANGAWRYYHDGIYMGQSGQAEIVNYPGNFVVEFRTSPDLQHVGRLDENSHQSFDMPNGPPGWEWVQYTYSALSSCP